MQNLLYQFILYEYKHRPLCRFEICEVEGIFTTNSCTVYKHLSALDILAILMILLNSVNSYDIIKQSVIKQSNVLWMHAEE